MDKATRETEVKNLLGKDADALMEAHQDIVADGHYRDSLPQEVVNRILDAEKDK